MNNKDTSGQQTFSQQNPLVNNSVSERSFYTNESDKKTLLHIGGLVGILGLFVLMALSPIIISLGGFSLHAPISNADRYYHINRVLDEIDYKSTGEVLSEAYDNNSNHPLNPTSFTATIEGKDTFGLLSQRVLLAVDSSCDSYKTEIACRMGRPSVSVKLNTDNTVTLSMNDTGTGR